jgi:hypothetical protein
MKAICRSVWIVWFDTYQGASGMDLRTLDWNLWMRNHFQSVRRSRKEYQLVYRQFVVEGKFRPPTKKRSEETEFSVDVSPFQSCVGVPRAAVQVEPKVANMLGRGNRNVIKEGRADRELSSYVPVEASVPQSSALDPSQYLDGSSTYCQELVSLINCN